MNGPEKEGVSDGVVTPWKGGLRPIQQHREDAQEDEGVSMRDGTEHVVPFVHVVGVNVVACGGPFETLTEVR